VATLVKVQNALGHNGWLAAALFDRLIASQDDEGRFEGDPVVVRNLCFTRHQESDVSSEEVTAHLGAMHRLGLIVWYRAEGGLYLCLPGFADNQSFHGWRPSPSDRPAPPETAPADPPITVCSAEDWAEALARVQGASPMCAAPASHQPDTDLSPTLHQLDTDPGEKQVQGGSSTGASRVRAEPEPEQNGRELEQKGACAPEERRQDARVCARKAGETPVPPSAADAPPQPPRASRSQRKSACRPEGAADSGKGQGRARAASEAEGGECGWCARPSTDSPSAVHRMLQACHDAYRERHADCPTLRPGRDGKLLRDLLRAGKSEERIQQVWRHYLESEDPMVARNGYDIPTFARLFDGVARAVDRGERHGEIRQHSGAGARRHLPSPESEFSDSGLVAL
jgi:hypothetical protein